MNKISKSSEAKMQLFGLYAEELVRRINAILIGIVMKVQVG